VFSSYRSRRSPSIFNLRRNFLRTKSSKCKTT
jgi:hypothetical protein